MTEATAQSGHHTSALVLGALTAVCIAITLAFLPTPSQEGSAVFTGILALIFGNMSFTRFEKAAAPAPPPQEFHDPDSLISRLKDGTQLTFLIQILFVAEKPSPSALDQIKYRVLRRLNETIPLLDVLYDNPLPATDNIIRKDIPDLCKELKLKSLTLRTIEIKTSRGPGDHSTGIFYGDH